MKYFSLPGILMDEMPPFDITISMSNEYGAKARLALYGIRIINEGNVISVNDVYTENTYQFLATDIEYLSTATGRSISGTPRAQAISSNRNAFLVKEESAAIPKPVTEEAAIASEALKTEADESEGNKIGTSYGWSYESVH